MSLALLLLAAAAAAAAAAPPPALVWSGATAALNLSVFADDSYAISLDGVPAFVSGVFALRVNSSWYVSLGGGPAPPPSATCANLTDTDCRGNDMYYFNTTSASQCCANCSANPACGAWTYTGETAAAAAAAPPYWAQRCYIKSACDASHYAGHTSGTQGGGSAALPLARLGAGPLAGQHATLGAYTGWEVRYTAGSTPVSTAFLFFPAGQGLFLFNTSFPQGAEGVAALTPGGGGGGGEFSASQQPSTQFPVLAAVPAAAPLGAVTWQGRFFSEAGAGSLGGAEGGPLAYFRSGAGNGSAPTLVLAPYTLFKSTHAGAPLAGQALPGTLALGLNAYVPALPPGFALSVSLTGSLAGVNDAVHAWGELLLASRGTVRATDPSSQALTYWTVRVGEGVCPHCPFFLLSLHSLTLTLHPCFLTLLTFSHCLSRTMALVAAPQLAPRARAHAPPASLLAPLPRSPPCFDTGRRPTTTSMHTSQILTLQGSRRPSWRSSTRPSPTAPTTPRCP